MKSYEDKNKCLKCGEINLIFVECKEFGVMMECSTVCSKCGYENFWAHGNYQFKLKKDEVHED